MRWAGIVLASFLVGGTAQAQEPLNGSHYTNGEFLTSRCLAYKLVRSNGGQGTADQLSDSEYCRAYVVGVVDAISVEAMRLPSASVVPICVPRQTVSTTLADVVANYLQAHPEKRYLNGPALVWMAVDEAWPCRKSTQ